MVPTTRRNDLDWLRVMAIAAVFLFHSIRFFDWDDPWSVRNAVTYRSLQTCVGFMAQWMMPFIFVVSAAGIFYQLRSRGSAGFLRDKVLRLLVPLVIGIFTHSILQVYLERYSHGDFAGSFWQFLPHYFDGMYGFGGNFAWMGLHLWYLEILFLFSLMFLPLFRWLVVGGGKSVLRRIGDFLALPGMIYAVWIPSFLILALVSRDSIIGQQALGGWSLASYLWFFAGGFLLFSSERLQQRISQGRWISFAIGMIFAFVPPAMRNAGIGPSSLAKIGAVLFRCHAGISSWAIILSFLGFGMRHLNRRTVFLEYTNEATLPFYIMHQTVLLTVGFFVVRWSVPDAAKWAIITVGSLAVIMGLYELGVRRIGFLRFLFGMKVASLKNRTSGASA